jgi:flagellar protein FlgJ
VSSIGRIGASGGVSRDSASAGLEAADRARDKALGQAPARNQKVDDVAKLYEKQFLREMVKAMRGTVSASDLTKPSMAEDIYRGQLDEQYVEAWGDNGGIGLSDLIYDQLMDRFFGANAGKELRKQGPIALTDRDISRVARVRSDGPVSGKQIPLRVEVKAASDGGPVQVKSPWDATVVSTNKVDGKTAVTLEHMPGVRSTVIFDGVPSAEVQAGRKLDKGQVVGVLSPEKNSFFWNLARSAGPLAREL